MYKYTYLGLYFISLDRNIKYKWPNPDVEVPGHQLHPRRRLRGHGLDVLLPAGMPPCGLLASSRGLLSRR